MAGTEGDAPTPARPAGRVLAARISGTWQLSAPASLGGGGWRASTGIDHRLAASRYARPGQRHRAGRGLPAAAKARAVLAAGGGADRSVSR